jgi:hypothetical protein
MSMLAVRGLDLIEEFKPKSALPWVLPPLDTVLVSNIDHSGRSYNKASCLMCARVFYLFAKKNKRLFLGGEKRERERKRA